MLKRAICMLLVGILAAFLALPAAAAETTQPETEPVLREPGQCGEALYWSLEDGVLTISGNGNMDDFPDGAPWLEWRDTITWVIFSGNVTSVGAGAFTDYDAITHVDFGGAMHTIGVKAFKSCDGLTEISLPDTFRRFGEECFMGCTGLTKIYCAGSMPSFNANCLWDTYVSIYYPADKPWPAEYVLPLYQAFQGRIEFYAGQEHMDIPRQTEPEQTRPPVVTQPETAVPETTVPETTVPTQPETRPVTEPATEPVQDQEETQQTAPAETVAPGKSEAPKPLNGIRVGLFLISGVLSLFLLGALVFRRRR